MPPSCAGGKSRFPLPQARSTDRRILARHRSLSRFVHATDRRIGDLLECADQTKEEYPMDNPHSSALVARHEGLDARIADEARRPSPDQMIIASLKKRKLKIKEALLEL
jgi:hypothetical protein